MRFQEKPFESINPGTGELNAIASEADALDETALN